MGTETGWQNYYELTKEIPPRALLVEAVKFVEARNEALDLGAGALTDSRFLLSEGFNHVTAVDGERAPDGIVQPLPKEKFEYVIIPFDQFNFPENTYDIVNAQFSLPFIPPQTFEVVLSRIKFAIKKGGIFAGQLFGDQDEWNVPGKRMTFHTVEQAKQLFADLEMLSWKEINNPNARLQNGKPKHWHYYNIIARK